MSKLSDLLNEANIDGWSSRMIARKAADAGHKIEHAAVAKYFSGDHGKPREPTLEALEAVFGIPLDELKAAADIRPGVTDVQLPPEVARLTPKQWAAVRQIIMSMVDPGESA